jgi:MOSC domain-containing protein YiiM
VPEQAADRSGRIEVRAGFGIVGDRYAGRPAHRDAAVTVLAAESVEVLAAELGTGTLDPLLARRNVALRGAEVEALRGQ